MTDNSLYLFDFTSKLDNQVYRASWDPNAPVIRVVKAPYGTFVSGSFPPVPQTGAVPLATDMVEAFEEGRLSHPDETNPYPRNPDRSAAWLFARALTRTTAAGDGQ